MTGDGQFRSSYYVAQENLEPVLTPENRLLQHPHISYFFPSFNEKGGYFNAATKLRYCFFNNHKLLHNHITLINGTSMLFK